MHVIPMRRPGEVNEVALVACSMDASFGGSSTPPPWHTDAVGGRPPVPSAASGKQKSYASQAGPPVGSDQASTSCLEHHDGTCAPTGWPMGHEIAGEVAALGPQASGVKVGDKVVAYPWIGCGECAVCRKGEELLCLNPRPLGTRRAGGYGTHVIVPHGRYLLPYG